MPFSRRREAWVGALALGHVGFPFGLSGQFCKASHVALPIEIVHRVANHKNMIFITINLHVKDTDLALAFDNLGPHMGVKFTVSFD